MDSVGGAWGLQGEACSGVGTAWGRRVYCFWAAWGRRRGCVRTECSDVGVVWGRRRGGLQRCALRRAAARARRTAALGVGVAWGRRGGGIYMGAEREWRGGGGGP